MTNVHNRTAARCSLDIRDRRREESIGESRERSSSERTNDREADLRKAYRLGHGVNAHPIFTTCPCKREHSDLFSRAGAKVATLTKLFFC